LDTFIILLQFSKHSVLIHLKTEMQATVSSSTYSWPGQKEREIETISIYHASSVDCLLARSLAFIIRIYNAPSYPGGGAAGGDGWPPPPSLLSSAEVLERVELYLSSPKGSLWPIKKGENLPTYNAQYIIYMYSMYSGWKLALIITHYTIQINMRGATQNFREFACNNFVL